MDPEKRAKLTSHLGPILIAHNATWSLITAYLPYFLMFGRRPRLPVDLLFPTMRRDDNTWTTDEYVTSLYDKLKLALASGRDTAILETQRQKWHYNRKAGAVELHPGDKVLVKPDAFRGQWQKLKNRWGDTLYTVVKHVVDGIPAYEVENDANKKRQVLHQAQLLLWLAEPEGEPLRINCISIESGLTRAELATPLRQSTWWAESMDGQRLARHCLALPLLFLHLGTMFPLITMLGFHVGFHGDHTSHCKAISMAG